MSDQNLNNRMAEIASMAEAKGLELHDWVRNPTTETFVLMLKPLRTSNHAVVNEALGDDQVINNVLERAARDLGVTP